MRELYILNHIIEHLFLILKMLFLLTVCGKVRYFEIGDRVRDCQVSLFLLVSF